MQPSADWIEDCQRWRGEVLTGVAAHWCWDWDDLPVDETTDEITSCTCDLSNLPGAEEARRRAQEVDRG
jgi:hypothetical protein